MKKLLTQPIRRLQHAAINCMFIASGLMATQVMASSHREAPLIANDPLADNTDLVCIPESG
jgi:hypothetical protein